MERNIFFESFIIFERVNRSQKIENLLLEETINVFICDNESLFTLQIYFSFFASFHWWVGWRGIERIAWDKLGATLIERFLREKFAQFYFNQDFNQDFKFNKIFWNAF